jgi:hypothetical protein
LARFLELIFGALLRTHFWRAFAHTLLARFLEPIFGALFRTHFWRAF